MRLSTVLLRYIIYRKTGYIAFGRYTVPKVDMGVKENSKVRSLKKTIV
jgi:hypothetical protein